MGYLFVVNKLALEIYLNNANHGWFWVLPTTLTSLVKRLHLYKAVYVTHGLLCAKNYCDGMGVKGKDILALLPDGPLLFTHQILLELKQGIGHSLPHTLQGERDTLNLVTNKDPVKLGTHYS